VSVTRWTLFDGPADADRAVVWLEEADSGVALRTHEWGAGVGRTSGSDTIESSVAIGGPALFTLACALVMDDPELDPTAPAGRPRRGVPRECGGERRGPSAARSPRSCVRIHHAMTEAKTATRAAV
jgi:hypothetical protein